MPSGIYTRAPADHRFRANVAPGPDCWLWNGLRQPSGHGRFPLNGAVVGAHRYALESQLGSPIPDGFDVLHTCDNPPCVRNDELGIYVVRGIARPRFGHLWLGTHHDNMADMAQKFRARGKGMLSEETVKGIREMRDGGRSFRDISRHFNVPISSAFKIAHRLEWKHVK